MKTGTYLVMVMIHLYQATRVYVSDHVILHSHHLEKANILGKEKEKNRVVPPILQLHPISSVIKIRNKSSITANNLKGKGNSTKHKVPYKIGGVDYFSEHFAPTFLIPKRS